jgi:hypothetical protein
MIIPITQKAQPDFGHYSEKVIIIMDTLPKQMKSKERDEDEDNIESERYNDAILLMSILKLISKTWGVDGEKLVNYQWLRKRKDHLCVHFIKKNLK